MSNSQVLRGVSFVAVCALFGASVALPAGASASVTGNAHAIALYISAVNATNNLPVLRDTSTDSYFLEDNINTLTNPSTFSYLLKGALPQAPSGYVDTTTVTTYRLRAGRVMWSTTLVLPRCGYSQACHDTVGLEFYDTPGSEKIALLHGAANKYCWAQFASGSEATFSFPASSGLWHAYGNYAPIRRVTGQILFTSSYSDNGIPITELDYLSDATHHFDKSVYQYAATSQNQADSITVHESDPAAIPAPPHFSNCKS